ncbi:hypothetical protein BA895_12135 [Humibacillus sp. DSM 29435]|nr:hypothetical protein BA895_12135 [Humibacillus sp. DSM 29435]
MGAVVIAHGRAGALPRWTGQVLVALAPVLTASVQMLCAGVRDLAFVGMGCHCRRAPAPAARPLNEASSMYTLDFKNVTKSYGHQAVVDLLTFIVQPGRVTGFLGPNGAGNPR